VAKGLWTDKNGQGRWRGLMVCKYLSKTDHFEGFWLKSGRSTLLPACDVVFEEEQNF
jgi:hypothetical protein